LGRRGNGGKLLAMLGVAARTRAVDRRLRTLARLNLELAKLEGRQKATAAGIALGLAIVAVVLVLYAVGFGLAAAAVGLNETLPLWLSLLVVTLALLLVAATLGFVASRFAKKVSPPLPTQAVEEAQGTLKAVKGHV
jgi:hypothetical protein